MNYDKVGRLGLVVLFLVVGLAACGAPAGPSIKAEEVWSRPAMAATESGNMTGTGAVFMLLKNEGKEADRLIGGQTDVAKAVEIHETVMEGDVMKMQMLAGGLEIPAGGDVLLKPGSYHLMLIGLQRDLQVGDKVSVELRFDKSGAMTVEAEVREP